MAGDGEGKYDADDGPPRPNPFVPLPPLTDAERACNVGDLLEVIASLELENPNDPVPAPILVQPSGQVYRAARLVSRGWDFELVSGDAPKELRLMNGDVRTFLKVLPSAKANHGA